MPSNSISEIGRPRILALYRTMLLIRQSEEQLAKSHQRGLIHGACHTYVGQEAVATGVCAHLSPQDAVFSTHRGHGHALAKGLAPAALMAELYGRETGCSQGRGGSMHLFSPEIGMMGTSGIVGPCILQAAGAGYSFMLMKRDNVAVAFFGDGASNNAAFHEGLNLASIWKLPVLFVCENNQFATEVPFKEATANPNVASRGASYGMPGIELDGNDVLAIQQAAGEAVKRARSGGGPTLFECKTYRTRPHAEGMGDFTYRTRADVDAWRAKCPIERLRGRIIAEGHATAAELEAVENGIQQLIEEAERAAQASPWPDPKSAATHIYAEPRPVPPEPPPGDRLISYSQATLEALSHEMAANPNIFVMGEGIGIRGGNFKTTAGLYEKYGPERLRDTPIAERGFVGLGGGAAMTGTRPVIDFMFADFVLDGIGEIVNQIAKMQYMSSGRLKMPILLRGCIGIGHSAATHHSGNYYPMFAHFPGLRVVVPSNAYDAKGLLHHALRCNDPVLFLEHREILTIKTAVPDAAYEIPFGQASVVREGRDLTVVALTRMVSRALEAAETLAKEGHHIEVIDPRTVAPLDVETIGKSVAKTGRLLIVDEAFGMYGIGAEIAAQVADRYFDELDAPIRRLNGLHTPTPYSPPLEAAVVLDTDSVVKAIRDLLSE
ncbi:MAG: dehydrogenase E1 component subunit alpha/beta [Planctomycetes bacterium]|nr:dehydrogenase E1 component subunit alpha/beta [Planctomycetota bacterium]